MTLTLGNLTLVGGSLLLLALLSWATYQSSQLLQEVPPEVNLLLSPPENVARFVLIAICAGLGWFGDVDLGRLGWRAANPLLLILQGALLGLAVQLLLSWITRRAVERLGKDVYSPVVVRNILPKNRQEAVLVALAFLPAALMEEMLFRSLLLGGFSVFFNPWLLAILWAMIFGAMHIPQGSLGMIATSVVGFVLSGAFILSGSLLAPLAAHYVINVLQIWDASRHREWLEAYKQV